MKKAMIVSVCMMLTVLTARPALSQQVQKMTFNAETNAILTEANVILNEEKGAVKVMMKINNTLPEGTPKVDLKRDDIVMGINGERIKTIKEFHALYDDLKPKTTIKLAVKRGDDLFFVSFPKIDPADLPGGGKSITMTSGGAAGSGSHRTTSTSQSGYDAGGYSVTEKDGRIVIVSLSPDKSTLLGDIDIEPGDCIQTLNGQKMTTLKEFFGSLSKLESGSSVVLEIERDGTVKSVSYRKQ